MRRFEPPGSRYTVQIGSPVWRQISHLPAETYRRIREELERVAASVAANPESLPLLPRDGGVPSGFSLVVGDYIVLYEVDSERRSVTLMDVARRLSSIQE